MLIELLLWRNCFPVINVLGEINYTEICACQEKQIAIAKNVIINEVLKIKSCPTVFTWK